MGIDPTCGTGPQGYRLYTPRHLQALRVARLMIQGFGWQVAQRIMQAIHERNLPLALATIDARHADIHQHRCEVEETLRMLQTTSTGILTLTPRAVSQEHSGGLRVSEAAKYAGVRASTLRFWEDQRLLHPTRDRISRYRLYDEEQLHILRTIALLRKSNYNFEAIRTILLQVAQGNTEQSLVAAEHRLKELAETTYRCVKATGALWEYLEELSLDRELYFRDLT